MARSRKAKSSVSVRISRPRPETVVSHAKKKELVVRSLSVYRYPSGRLASSTSHIVVDDPQSGLKSAKSTSVTPAQSVDHQTSCEHLDSAYMQDEDVGINDYSNDNDNDGGRPTSQKVRSKFGIITLAHILQLRPIDEWLPHREAYLDEMIRHDGRNGRSSACSQCSDPGDYKCQDCAFGKYYCKTCIMEQHAFLPLHRLLVLITNFICSTCTDSWLSIGPAHSMKMQHSGISDSLSSSATMAHVVRAPAHVTLTLSYWTSLDSTLLMFNFVNAPTLMVGCTHAFNFYASDGFLPL